MTLTVATDRSFALAEGPFWDAPRHRLLWVDILAGQVFEGCLSDGRIEVTAIHDVDALVGAVSGTADGALLVAAQERLVVLDPDGRRRPGPRIVPAGSGRRCNDGSTDPEGRFLVGTLAFSEDTTDETLSRLEHDGSLTLLDDDLTLSNGLAWSTDGSLLYSVDSGRRTVWVRDYLTGGPRRPHLTITDGYPDGIALDVEDHLWVAVWGVGEVRRFAPDGTLVSTLSVPAPHTSCVAFAGAELDVLVVTTARKDLTDAQLQEFPLSGHLFTTVPGVRGAPVPFWSPAF